MMLSAPIEWVVGLFPLLPGRRRTITLMFTDIEGFTRHAAGPGNGAALRLLHRHDRAVLPALRRHGGRIVKRLGDGLMAVFSSSPDALAAAVAMQRAAAGDPGGLSLRIGLHAGEARVREGDLVGHDVNVASRIADRTPGGQVLVSDAVRATAGAMGVRFRRRRALVVGGRAMPVFLAEPIRVGPPGSSIPPRLHCVACPVAAGVHRRSRRAKAPVAGLPAPYGPLAG